MNYMFVSPGWFPTSCLHWLRKREKQGHLFSFISNTILCFSMCLNLELSYLEAASQLTAKPYSLTLQFSAEEMFPPECLPGAEICSQSCCVAAVLINGSPRCFSGFSSHNFLILDIFPLFWIRTRKDHLVVPVHCFISIMHVEQYT